MNHKHKIYDITRSYEGEVIRTFDNFCPFLGCDCNKVVIDKYSIKRIDEFTFKEEVFGHCENCGGKISAERFFKAGEWDYY